MSTFAVFGMTAGVALAEARKITTWASRPVATTARTEAQTESLPVPESGSLQSVVSWKCPLLPDHHSVSHNSEDDLQDHAYRQPGAPRQGLPMPTETQLEQRVAALQSDLNAKDQALDDAATENNERELSRRDWFEEAQRLQAELDKRPSQVAMSLQTKIRGLQAKLAERDALLRDVLDGKHTTPGWNQRMKAALSASAEPCAKPCEHEWTDDGEFLLVCTACGAQEDHNPGWLDMATAPRDGTMLRLLVEFEDHSTEDADQAPTIGANNFDNDEIDEWKFAGWCWTHDHFVEGKGTPVGWLPMLDSKPTEGASHE